MLTPADDHFHPRSDSPFWNESGWFSFQIPEREIDGWVFCYHRPNIGLSAGGVAMWDPSGEHTFDCLYYELHQHQATPAGADMFDFTLDNGLTVACVEEQKKFNLGFKSLGIDLHLEWEGAFEPHELEAPPSKKVNEGLEHWGNGHYDQLGRVRGEVVVEGESYAVDAWSLRDHSWGPRPEIGGADPARGGYSWAMASTSSAFQVHAMSPLPSDNDPIIGTTEKVVGGWYVKDGVMADLVSGEYRTTERRDDGAPLTVELEAVDALGRTLRATGKSRNRLQWHGYTIILNWWCLASWEFDGLEASGEIQDYYTLRRQRLFRRSKSGNATSTLA